MASGAGGADRIAVARDACDADATSCASGGRRERLAEDLLDRRARGGAGLVLRELHADALRAVALHAFGRDPDDLALHGDAVADRPSATAA